MFTGIVTDIGTVECVSDLPEGRRYRVATSYDVPGIAIGASIAHAGVCLTVVEKGASTYDVEAWEEALRLTTAGRLARRHAAQSGARAQGRRRAGRPHRRGPCRRDGGDRRRAGRGRCRRFTLRAPGPLAKFIAPKGSVALDGTSLTVNGVDGTDFDVLIIRHTLEVTTWGDRRSGDRLNIEIDTMARYAERILSFRD